MPVLVALPHADEVLKDSLELFDAKKCVSILVLLRKDFFNFEKKEENAYEPSHKPAAFASEQRTLAVPRETSLLQKATGVSISH